jgi:hypothetical protein
MIEVSRGPAKQNLDQDDLLPQLKNKFSKKTLFFYDDIIGTFQYAPGHPMKPFRVAMTDELVRTYEMYPHMDTYDESFTSAYLSESID